MSISICLEQQELDYLKYIKVSGINFYYYLALLSVLLLSASLL